MEQKIFNSSNWRKPSDQDRVRHVAEKLDAEDLVQPGMNLLGCNGKQGSSHGEMVSDLNTLKTDDSTDYNDRFQTAKIKYLFTMVNSEYSLQSI